MKLWLLFFINIFLCEGVMQGARSPSAKTPKAKSVKSHLLKQDLEEDQLLEDYIKNAPTLPSPKQPTKPVAKVIAHDQQFQKAPTLPSPKQPTKPVAKAIAHDQKFQEAVNLLLKNELNAFKKHIDFFSIDVNIPYRFQNAIWFLLTLAIQNHHLDIVNFLISKKADLEARDSDGSTPLFIAVLANDIAMVDRLLQAGANVDAQNNDGFTALLLALSYKYNTIAQRLLEANANVNIPTRHGFTALMLAVVDNNDTRMINELIKRNAFLNAETDDGMTALIKAVLFQFENIVKTLIQAGANVDFQPKINKKNALMFAIQNGYTSMVDLLILHFHANVNLQNIHKDSALFFAIANNHLDCVPLLLENGANLDLQNDVGLTPIMLAVKYEQEAIVHLLIQHHANVNLSDRAGVTALVFAILKNSLFMIDALLKAGAWVNIKTMKGYTPLTIAISHKKLEITQMLLEAGAFPDLPGKDDLTPLMYAVMSNEPDIVKLILSLHVNVNACDHTRDLNPLILAIKNKNLEVVKMLLSAGADPSVQMEDKATALIWAAKLGLADIVDVLLDAGVDINTKDQDGFNAFMIALLAGHAEIALKLLDEEEDPKEALRNAESVLNYNKKIQESKPHSKGELSRIRVSIQTAFDGILKIRETKGFQESSSETVQRKVAAKSPAEIDSKKQSRKFLRKQREIENQKKDQARRERISKLAELQFDNALALLKDNQGYDEYQLAKYKDLFTKKITEKFVYLAPLHYTILYGYPSVLVDIDHIINPQVDWELNEQQKYVPIIKGGHTKKSIQSLIEKNIVSVLSVSSNANSPTEYSLQNLWTGVKFKKTIFPEDWTLEQIKNAITTGEVTFQASEDDLFSVDIYSFGLLIKLIFKENQPRALLGEKSYKLITAYPIVNQRSDQRRATISPIEIVGPMTEMLPKASVA